MKQFASAEGFALIPPALEGRKFCWFSLNIRSAIPGSIETFHWVPILACVGRHCPYTDLARRHSDSAPRGPQDVVDAVLWRYERDIDPAILVNALRIQLRYPYEIHLKRAEELEDRLARPSPFRSSWTGD